MFDIESAMSIMIIAVALLLLVFGITEVVDFPAVADYFRKVNPNDHPEPPPPPAEEKPEPPARRYHRTRTGTPYPDEERAGKVLC